MKEEALAEAVNNKTKEVAGRTERKGAQNPRDRACVLYFDGMGFMSELGKGETGLTYTLADAYDFGSFKVAQRFESLLFKGNNNGDRVKTAILMYPKC